MKREALRSLGVSLCVILLFSARTHGQSDPLPSWNEGAAKKAIVDFVRATTQRGSPTWVPHEARIATFDQDGTLWVEHPMYSQVMYCFERVPALVKAKPELANVEPFKTVDVGQPRGDREAPDGGVDEDPRRHTERDVGR